MKEKEAAELQKQMDKDYDDYLNSLKDKVDKEKESKSNYYGSLLLLLRLGAAGLDFGYY